MRVICMAIAFLFAFGAFNAVAHHQLSYSSPPDTATTHITEQP